MTQLDTLSDEAKIELYKKIRLKYPWCTSSTNIKRLALIELKKHI